MKFFLDTNVIVDFLAERDEYYEPAAQVINLADKGEVELCCSALSFATVFYLVRPIKGKAETLAMLREFSKICEVSSVNSEIVDAIQYFCALSANADIIITRNTKDFKNSTIQVKKPSEIFE